MYACDGGVADTDRLDWLEARMTLRNNVEFLYVVDGIQLTVIEKDNPVWVTTRESLREALDQAMEVFPCQR